MDIQRGKEVRRNRILEADNRQRDRSGRSGVRPAMGVAYVCNRRSPARRTCGSIYPDTVKRGPMLREVHGLGTLVAEEVLWVPAIADGLA